MKGRSAVVAGCVTVTAAVLGNAFIGRDTMSWFGDLNKPRWQLPMPGFLVAGATYYGIVGYVLARGVDREDSETIRWAGTVLVANEAWNALLFVRRSPGTAFAGLLGFLAPSTVVSATTRRSAGLHSFRRDSPRGRRYSGSVDGVASGHHRERAS